MHKPLSQILYNCAMTSKRQNNTIQRTFWKTVSWIIILRLAQKKVSISFLDRLINFLPSHCIMFCFSCFNHYLNFLWIYHYTNFFSLSTSIEISNKILYNGVSKCSNKSHSPSVLCFLESLSSVVCFHWLWFFDLVHTWLPVLSFYCSAIFHLLCSYFPELVLEVRPPWLIP